MSSQLTAENLSTSLQGVQTIFGRVPLETWRKAVCALLIILILYILSQFVWFLIPRSDSASIPIDALPAIASKGQEDIDVAVLQSYNLFGSVDPSAVVPEEETNINKVELDAQPTKLNLKLQGVVQSNEESKGLAIIVSQGKQDQYLVGDKLPVGGVSLAKVLTDHVILDNRGKYESLWLFDDSTQTGKSPGRAVRTKKTRTAMAKDYRERLYKNPSSLAQVLRVTPAQRNGEMIGYRVSPGKDKEQFSEMGFKAGDIVTSVNDVALDDPAQAMEVYKIMRTARNASFTIERDGEPVQIVVSLDDQ